jgi:ankyrin repeat protein
MADVDAQSKIGWSVLMWAARRGYTKVVKSLIKAGADVSLKDENGMTAWMMAQKKDIRN